ncbi:MAG: SCO family protein [Deltaproteobacteria bacterium]|nr:SCO family protein [Deltaproteobacteria bacterium]
MSKFVRCFLLILGFLGVICVYSGAAAIEKPGEELQEVGIKQRLGEIVDLSLPLTSADGDSRPIKSILDEGKPIMLVPVYFECPRLCGLLLSGVLELLNNMDLELGKDFQVLTVSFDPSEGPKLAQKRAAEYRSKLTKGGENSSNWHFAVGADADIDALMRQIGFQYKPDGKDFAHTAAVIILTPEGEISQYFTGIEFSPWDVRLALVEASRGKVGSLFDQVLLFCFRYDHLQGKYTWAAFNFVRVGAILSVLGLISLVYFAARR